MAKTPAKAPAPAVQAGKTAGGAQAPEAGGTDPKAKKAAGGISILAFMVLTMVAGAAGAGFGTQVSSLLLENMATKEVGRGDEKKIAKLSMSVLPLPPITTNLAGTSRVWVRLECSLITPMEMAEQAVTLTSEVGEDIIAYLRTVTIEQLDGPGGFQHLREDINDRVRIRTSNKSTGLIIQALIIE